MKHGIAGLLPSNWVPPVPADKSMCGFHHNKCGQLLCPVEYDWSDPASVILSSIYYTETNMLFRVKESLKTGQGTYSAGPANLCYFLWPDGEFDFEDPVQGFLRNQLIVKVMIAVVFVMCSRRTEFTCCLYVYFCV